MVLRFDPVRMAALLGPIGGLGCREMVGCLMVSPAFELLSTTGDE